MNKDPLAVGEDGGTVVGRELQGSLQLQVGIFSEELA